MPTELAIQGIDKLTGGEGEAESLVEVAARLNSQLPEEYQNAPLAKDLGYAADFLAPSPTKFLKTLGMMNKGQKVAKTAAEIYRDAKIAGKVPVIDKASRASQVPETVQELLAAERAAKDFGKIDNIVGKTTPGSLRELLGVPKESLSEKIGSVTTVAPKAISKVADVTEDEVMKLYTTKYASQMEDLRNKLDKDTFDKLQQSRLNTARQILKEQALKKSLE
jgi:hypothetical protein